MPHEQKLNIVSSDEECPYPTILPLVEINRTRQILFLAIAVQCVIAVIATVVAIHFEILACNFKLASLQTALLVALLLICLTFTVGLFAAHRYHVNALHLFANLLLVDLIVLHLICIFFFVVPVGTEKYRRYGTMSTAVFVLSYSTGFCAAAMLPAFTVRFSNKMANLLTNVREGAHK